MVTRGQERCLYVWPSAEFRAFTDELRKAPVTNKRARDYMRMLFAGASAENADRQGRVTLPPMLRDYAGLTATASSSAPAAASRSGTPTRGTPTAPSRSRRSPTGPRRCCRAPTAC